METLECMTMEKILKKVYDVHRQTLSETNTSLVKYKTSHARLVEKNRQLQTEKAILLSENKNLQLAVSSNKNRAGSCCEVIRDSLETVISSYKQLLQEKDSRIKQLEEELWHKRGNLVTDSLEHTPVRLRDSVKRVGRELQLLGQSPDSTCVVTPKVTPDKNDNATPKQPLDDSLSKQSSSSQRATKNTKPIPKILGKESPSKNEYCREDNVTMETKASVANDDGLDDLIFDEALEMVDTQKPRLQMRRNKRNRFSEEISPEVKRQRQTSPGSGKGSDITKDSVSKNMKAKSPGVLVPDTCSLDDSFDVKDQSRSRVKGAAEKYKPIKGKRKDGGIQEDFSMFVVPETLAMDVDSEISDEDERETVDEDLMIQKGNNDTKGKKFEPELSDINEMSVESSRTDYVEGRKSLKTREDLDGSKAKIREDDSNLKRAGRTRDLNDDTKDIQYSRRSILDSPGSGKEDSDDDKGIKNAINHRTLDLSGSSICLDSDEDDLEDTLKNESSQTSRGFVRKSQVLRMKQIDELFETPEKGKGDVEATDDDGKRTADMHKQKPLFKKSVSYIETNEDTVLRRSPRKHAKVYTSASNSKRKGSFESGKCGKNHDGDSTRKGSDSVGDNRQSLESQSLDMYNVVPIKNGVPVTSKMFQFKVSKSGKQGQKNTEREASKPKMKSFQSPKKIAASKVDIENETLTSSSVLDMRSQSKVSEVVDLCSPSVGSVSDPESPLLLQTSEKSFSKHTRSKFSQSSESIMTNHKGKKLNISRKNKHDETLSDNSQSSKARPNRNCHRRAAMQMTLTQGFFSPEKKNGRKKSQTAEDEELKKALKISLEEAEKHENRKERHQLKGKVNKRDEFSFKKPLVPLKKDQHIKPSTASYVSDDLDETVAPESESLSVLGGVPADGPTEVNGSLDPAADLTMWCQEPDTVEERETAPGQTLSTLPSLDADFLMDDLHDGEDSLQKTSTLVAEDSQDIPSTSASYKFGPRKKIGRQDKTDDKENLEPETTSPSKGSSNILDDSFDRPPKKAESKVAHVSVVRKQDERQKLQGHSCQQCLEYYKAAGLDETEIKHHMQQCSRHRAEFVPPNTPPHFWSVGFIDTQECVDRGYLKVENAPETTVEQEPKFRRRRRLNKYFKSKNERSTMETDSQDDF